jgi:HEAT repeat protein
MPSLTPYTRPSALAAWISPLLLLALGPVGSDCRADFDEVIDSPMYHSPELVVSRVEAEFPEEAKALWLKALRRPEVDLRCKAAEAIARAHERGVQGLESMVAPLREALNQADQHPAVRLAAAQALIALDARQAAADLLQQAESSRGELRYAIEPALARWKYRPASSLWLARLEDPKAPSQGLVLAIRGLAAVGETRAVERLRALAVSDPTERAVRLEAAHALAVLRPEGGARDAEALLSEPPGRGVVPRLVAAALLRQSRGEDALRLLERLAADEEPAVAALAVTRLIELDPQRVVPMLPRLVASPDAKLRLLAVDGLFRQAGEEHLRALGDRLNDPHPDVRRTARKSLLALAKRRELRDPVIRQGERLLAGHDWRGQEQAAILLAQLDDKTAGTRLVELLASERAEVFITAAWGLRRLAVADTLPAIVTHVESEERRLRGLANNPDAAVLLDHKLSQLNQLLGQQKYAPADKVLRRFIPRMESPRSAPFGQESRAAAIWALGLIHEGQSEHDLARAVQQRLDDIGSLPPEDVRVRTMSAITLGRTKAQESLPSLRTYLPASASQRSLVDSACVWAVERLTGEVFSPPKPTQRLQRDWFLVPDR